MKQAVIKSQIPVFLFLLTFLVYFFSSPGDNHWNYYSRLANSFTHGKAYLNENPPWLNELIPDNGKYYVVYPPMPAVLMTPLVFLKPDFSQTFFSILLGSVNVALVFVLFRRLHFNIRSAGLMSVIYGFGTNHWYLASIGSAWYLAHIVAVFFLLLALIETFGRKRFFLIGLLLGASFWARTTVIFTIPFFYIILYKSFWPLNKKTILNFLLFNGGVVVFILLDFWYNYIRFGNPSPLAPYEFIPDKEKGSEFQSGFLKLGAITKHLEAAFWRFPVIINQFPYLVPSVYSLAIWVTTPVVLFVFNFKKKLLTLASWAAIIPTFFVLSLWAGVGYTQFGYRFSQDFMLFLIILIGLGIGNKPRLSAYFLIALSVLINLWGVIVLNKYNISIF
jgi:hypothetical protein